MSSTFRIPAAPLSGAFGRILGGLRGWVRPSLHHGMQSNRQFPW